MVSTRWEKRELAICKGGGRPVSDEEKNKALVREFFEEAWANGNVAAVDEFMAADYVEHPRPSTLPPGTEDFASYRTAFPIWR
jgi:predicted SnoaL-like aldol condensation-catalyzing enzyme